jgi:hypothetical protein
MPGKRQQLASGTPLASPGLQPFRTYLVGARHLHFSQSRARVSWRSSIREDTVVGTQANRYGNPSEARQSGAEALKLAPTTKSVEVEAALAFAMAGDRARADSFAQDLGKRFPLDTQIQSLWLPAIQGQLALERKNPVAALNALQAASTIELGLAKIGGPGRDRTDDLFHAMQLQGQPVIGFQ